MTTRSSAVPFVLAKQALDDHESRAVITGAVAAEADVCVVEVNGPGVVACLQGVLTVDVESVGDGGFLYGAVLTPKGMIKCDLWIARLQDRSWLSVPAAGRDTLLELLQQYFPPRLAKTNDRSDDLSVVRIAGPSATQVAKDAGFTVPSHGSAMATSIEGFDCVVARPKQGAAFGLQIQLDHRHVPTLIEKLEKRGAVVSNGDSLELARILAGWPLLHAEIDEKTLPQEVRFDDLSAISYTKGCYTGQETVARIHFRGRINKELMGLTWDTDPDPENTTIVQDDKPIGRVSSIAWFPPIEQHIGLGIINKQADPTKPFVAASAPAGQVRLPFQLPL